MTEARRVLTFHSDAVADDTLHITELSGTEEISRYYVFHVELVSTSVDIDFKEMLSKPASIGIKQSVKLKGGDKRAVQTLRIHGVLSSFEQMERGLDWVRYRAELVPPLWKLSLSYQSRIFIDKSVVDIVKEVLEEYGLKENTDFEFRTGTYPKREFAMQYEESDLDFIDRWLEHEGISYFWEHGDSASKLILADNKAANNPIQGDPTIAYNPSGDADNRVEAEDSEAASEDWFKEEVVAVFAIAQRVIPKKVVLTDYNWRKPSESLQVEAPAGKDGLGFVFEYNNHYKDKAEGNKLAKVRAEEILCREIVYSGESDCRSFRAGGTYTLQRHFREDVNKSHLLVAVEHTATQSVELATGSSVKSTYRNRFQSIPADRVFRAPQRTAWPKIAGVLNAIVDAAGSGDYAEIDDMGRYKVRFLLDLSGRKDGTASRHVRMAQPYSGPGMGFHCPLHKGTEVLVGFVDGDPDRPLILASIPNAETLGPVAGGNQSQCKLHTGGGNSLTIEDRAGSQSMTMSTPSGNTVFSMGIG